MSQFGVFARFERSLKPRPKIPYGYNGEALFLWYVRAQEVAKELGVRSLADLSSMTAGQADDAMKLRGLAGPRAEDATDLQVDRWHEPAEGLVTIRTLLSYIKADPQALAHGDGYFEDTFADAVLSDLKGIETELKAAEKQGVRFAITIA